MIVRVHLITKLPAANLEIMKRKKRGKKKETEKVKMNRSRFSL